jgi:PKD repeat protein
VDASAVEVGVRFKSDVAGTVTGIRFYKGSDNTGPHVGQLFSASGALLATATFGGETSSGWQQVNFDKPVAIDPNVIYVAAYHTDAGHYAIDQGYFTSSGVDNGPLHAPVAAGVFAYGAAGTFPDQVWNGSNYWVDVVFATPDPPTSLVANAGPARSTPEGGAVTFAGSVTGATDPSTYFWNFGDGTTGTRSLTPTHVYANHGTFTATLTVTDSLGHSSTSSTTVTVADVAPTANAGGPYSGAPGLAISFNGSATDPGANDAPGFTYAWDFGDQTTSTLQNPTHAYAAAGNYVVTLRVTEASGLSTTVTTTATVVSVPPAGPYVVTPYDKIPNFGYKPTVISVRSGNWSDPTVWSTGKLPGAGDVVDIMAGTTVVYDVNSTVKLNTIAIQANGSLKFRTDVNTMVYVGNFEVLPGGYLEIGTQSNPVQANVMAQVFIANQALDPVIDPEQFGTGLIVLGKISTYGAVKTPYVTLSTEPRVGNTVLHFATPVVGWRAGDVLELPDTRQLDDRTMHSNYLPQWEQLIVQSVSADGLSVTLTAPLQFNHLGARDDKGVLTFLPHVINETRNVMFASEEVAAGQARTFGYTLFTYRADVNVQNTGFCELGRTTSEAEDDTVLDSSGSVTHYGTNQGDRTPMTLLNLLGPTTPQANGYQFTLIGNVVNPDCLVCTGGAVDVRVDNNHLWGIVLNNSHYGLIQKNTVYNVAGTGIGAESGNETGNVFDGNLVMRVNGTGGRLDKQRGGYGFWTRGPNNRLINNIATDINGGGWDQYSYGFGEDSSFLGTIKVPAYQGADPSRAGQFKTLNGNDLPLAEFNNNEAYGATGGGLTLWWIGTFNDTPYADAQQTVLKNFHVWNVYARAYFGYQESNVLIDGWVVRGDVRRLADGYSWSTGLYFADYLQDRIVIQNVDIQGMDTGINAPINMGWESGVGTTVIQNSYLSNSTNIEVTPPRTVGGTNGLEGKRLNVISVTFAHPPQAPAGSRNISLDAITTDSLGTSNFSVPDLVYVYNYNGILNNNFQVFYSEEAHPDNATAMSGIGGLVVPF